MNKFVYKINKIISLNGEQMCLEDKQIRLMDQQKKK